MKTALFYYETFVGGGADLTTTASVERDIGNLLGRRGNILRAVVTGTGTVDLRINDNADMIRLTGTSPENDWTFDTTKFARINEQGVFVGDTDTQEQAQISFIKLTLVTGTPTIRIFIY